MKGIIAEDQVQLDRIERTIASIKARPVIEQARMSVLLTALQKEKAHILHCSRRTPQRPRIIRRPMPGNRGSHAAV
jgi:hypothetical protein